MRTHIVERVARRASESLTPSIAILSLDVARSVIRPASDRVPRRVDKYKWRAHRSLCPPVRPGDRSPSFFSLYLSFSHTSFFAARRTIILHIHLYSLITRSSTFPKLLSQTDRVDHGPLRALIPPSYAPVRRIRACGERLECAVFERAVLI